MANEDGPLDASPWPLPKFYFSVCLGGVEVPFQEVSGLDIENEASEYRAGNSKPFSVIQMPGLQRTGTVTLKKGVFTNDNAFWDWFKAIKMNTINRSSVTIKLLDETGATTMAWTLTNAFPTKVRGSDLRSEGNEVAVESVELSYEHLQVSDVS
jgi:phage tail-like protein